MAERPTSTLTPGPTASGSSSRAAPGSTENEDTIACELGKHEGVLIPHGVKYWFESVGDEKLEIMHITGHVPGTKQERLNFTPILPQQQAKGINVFEYEERRQNGTPE